MGDFKVGVSVGVDCTKCTLNTGVSTNFEITQSLSYQVDVDDIIKPDVMIAHCSLK
jgi:hypothetical protein